MKPSKNHPKSQAGLDLSSVQIFATTEDVPDGFQTSVMSVYKEQVRDVVRIVADLEGVQFPVLLGEASIRRLIKALGPLTTDWEGKTVQIDHAGFLKDGETIGYLSVKPV